MTQVRYNYAGSGRDGHNNKGKKYINYTEEPTITKEIQDKLNEYNDWFNLNYSNIKQNLISKNNYNEEVLTDTYLKVYRYILYGGEINNLNYYFNTSYFTNQFNYTCTTTRYNNRIEYISTTTDDYDTEDTGDSEAQYAAKDELINLISEWLECNVPGLIERELFIIYINTRYDKRFKMTYEKLAELTGVDINRIKDTIPRIKKQLQQEFKNKRLNTL